MLCNKPHVKVVCVIDVLFHWSTRGQDTLHDHRTLGSNDERVRGTIVNIIRDGKTKRVCVCMCVCVCERDIGRERERKK